MPLRRVQVVVGLNTARSCMLLLQRVSTTRIARGNKSVIEEIPTYNSKGLAMGLELRVPEYKASGLESFRENLSDSQSYAA